MLTALLITLAIIPGLIIVYFIHQADKHEKEDRKELILAFAVGALITIPVWIFESWAHESGWEDATDIGKTLFFSFVIVGLAEEGLKLGGLLAFAFPKRFFNEPMDGIVYAVMIAMGFATVENILYANKMSVTTMVVRAFTAVPAHGIFAVVTGYYVGMAKFDKAKRWKLLAYGLLLTVVLHGAYDFFIIIESYEWLGGLALVSLFLSFWYAYKLLRLHQNNSPFRPEEQS